MTLANKTKVRGNLLPEGMAAPISATFPPDAEDGQTVWKTPEQQLYVYRTFPLDTWFPVGTPSSHFELVIEQIARLNSASFASVRTNFFDPLGGYNGPNRGIGTWATLYRHCYWQFTYPPTSNVWSGPRKFDTEDDLFDYLEGYVPSSGGIYTENVRFRVFESVDDADYFPSKLHYRNSLAASIMGRRRWVNKYMPGVGQQYFGVDPKFNYAYYLNYANELGQRFVIEALGSDPGSNNDDIVWFHHGKRGTLLRYPKIGSSVNARGMCWDNDPGVQAYVPASGGFTVLEPFYLVENKRNALLSITPHTANSEHRQDEMFSPVVAVFPLVRDLVTPVPPPDYSIYRYYAFMMVPINYDNFVTEWIDTDDYEISLCVRYRDTYSKVYDVATHHNTGSASTQVLMWTTPDIFQHRNGARLDTDVDGDFIPVSVDLARRNIATGQRSGWVPLYKIRRHVKHAGIKISPARHGR